MADIDRNNFMNAEMPDKELIMQWLNTSALSQNQSEKVEILHKLQEFLTRKTPHLLCEFLPNILNFVTDKNSDVKKVLVGFIEEICKLDEQYLVDVMVTLHMLLYDESIAVQKRVIQGAITIYRRMLGWLCKASNISEKMEQAWNQLNLIKVKIANLIDSDNDGVRTSAVKFLECVVLLQTYPDNSESRPANDFSLEDVPLTLKIIRRRKLEEEAHNIFELLLKFTGSQHISSANLFACLGALTNIGKNRPSYMPKVVSAIEMLHSNLPPTLSSTQVNSIRKKLKSELSSLIKHPATYDFIENISLMLVELGFSPSEVQKMIPKMDERTKRPSKRQHVQELLQSNKRQKLLDRELEIETYERQKRQALETNEKFVFEKLNTEKVVELVLLTLGKLPDSEPPQFEHDYMEFMGSGMVGQYKALITLLAEYLLNENLGPGAEILPKVAPVFTPPPDISNIEECRPEKKKDLEEEEKEKKKEKVKVPRIKTLKLPEITKPLDRGTRETLMIGAVKRLLSAERGRASQLRQKVLVTMGASFTEIVWETILSFLLSDLRAHLDLALSWLYEEYSIMQGFSRLPPLRRGTRPEQGYSNLIKAFISSSSSDALVLSRLFLEVPLVTDDVLEILCSVCRDENRCAWALGLLRDLILRRPPKQITFLKSLLSLTVHESNIVRDLAVKHMLDLYKIIKFKETIETFACVHLEFLRLAQPPEDLFGSAHGRNTVSDVWSDDLIKACLLPYMYLLPDNEALIHDLAKVYIQTNADIKRTILRLLESPVRTMGMESQELLKLVEECPKGSETLVTRVIHILTDKGPPSQQLVQIVRELYQTRVSDVRFLIPVLNGLTKKEVIAALPKLIKLNPVVVREVFNRLLGLHGDSPINPTELLVALHLIDSSKADLKTVMKATSMCLNEKQVFTQEVLAVVLQQLMDQTPLPTLLMRTVIQALGSYPRLSGFVMNILQRLILKQVWKQKVVWEGFIKCCQRTKPQSFTVLMQLPAPQLLEALSMSPDLHEPLRQHLLNFSDSQRAHIPATIQEVIFGPSPQQLPPTDTQNLMSQNENMQIEPLPPGME